MAWRNFPEAIQEGARRQGPTTLIDPTSALPFPPALWDRIDLGVLTAAVERLNALEGEGEVAKLLGPLVCSHELEI